MRSEKRWERNISRRHLNADFKKKNGYQRSTQLSREYGIYRQNYCGCVFSKRERVEQKKDQFLLAFSSQE